MNIRDLKYKLNTDKRCELEEKEFFIYNYGAYNCKMLKFKDANTVINLMGEYDASCLNKKQKEFIVKNSNKEVLCSLNHIYQDNPDIFVFGDDNVAFQIGCFV